MDLAKLDSAFKRHRTKERPVAIDPPTMHFTSIHTATMEPATMDPATLESGKMD